MNDSGVAKFHVSDTTANSRPPRRVGIHRAPQHHRGRHRAPLAASIPPQGRYAVVVGAAIVGAGAVALGSATALPVDTPATEVVAVPTTDSADRAEPVTRHPAGEAVSGGDLTRVGRDAGRAESPIQEQPAEEYWQAPLDEFELSSLFGIRWGLLHQGLDFAADEGTPVYAAYSGTVVHSGTNGGFGQLVIIDHGDGVESYYAHNSSLAVAVGDTVRTGDQIAEVGNTGNSYGPHSHFEIHRDGEAVDPLDFLAEQGVNLSPPDDLDRSENAVAPSR